MQRPVFVRHKSLRSYPDDHGSVAPSGHIQHRVAAEQQPSALYLAVKDVDGRRAEEFGDKEVFRRVVYLLRATELLHRALVHHDDVVGDAHGFFLVVGDEYRGDSRLALEAAQLLAGLQAQPCVQIGQRLVEQQHTGTLDERPRNGDALLLTAGKLRRTALHERVELDEPRGLKHAALHLRLVEPCRAAQVLEREENVLAHRHVRVQRVALEHKPHAPCIRRQLRHVVVAEQHAPRRGLFQPADEVERGAFAAAGRSQQPDHLTVGYLKIERPHGDDLLTTLSPCGKFFRQPPQHDLHIRPPHIRRAPHGVFALFSPVYHHLLCTFSAKPMASRSSMTLPSSRTAWPVKRPKT